MMRFLGIFLSVGLFFLVPSSGFFSVLGYSNILTDVECSYLTKPIITGRSNDVVAVLKLQYFLNAYEGFQVELTGVYDKQTIDAVRLFQAGYAADILIPWGLSRPTGDVSITTLHKINEVYCGDSSGFSKKELVQMNAIQKRYVLLHKDFVSSATTSTTASAVGAMSSNRPKGVPVGFTSMFALPILVMLLILLPTQVYYMWGIAPHRKIRLIPRGFK